MYYVLITISLLCNMHYIHSPSLSVYYHGCFSLFKEKTCMQRNALGQARSLDCNLTLLKIYFEYLIYKKRDQRPLSDGPSSFCLPDANHLLAKQNRSTCVH